MSTVGILPGIDLRLGYLALDGCTVREDDRALGAAYAAQIEAARTRFAGRTLAEDPAIQGVRKLFRAVGVDPGRYRPSGEALARRALKSRPPPRVNSLVDINNLCSLATLYPWGSYDHAHITGDVQVRLGAPGESYPGIDKAIHVAGRLVSADARGAFGSPIADSARTCISTATRSALVLVYAPTDTPRDALDQALGRYATLAANHVGGRVIARGIIEGEQIATLDDSAAANA